MTRIDILENGDVKATAEGYALADGKVLVRMLCGVRGTPYIPPPEPATSALRFSDGRVRVVQIWSGTRSRRGLGTAYEATLR